MVIHAPSLFNDSDMLTFRQTPASEYRIPYTFVESLNEGTLFDRSARTFEEAALTQRLYDVVVGDEEGQVPIRKLNQHMVRLPRNLDQRQVNALEKRMAALGGTKAAPLPKGPMPGKARTSGLERTLRRR